MSGPALPNYLQGSDTDNILKELNDMPFFMNQMPENIEDNERLQALQALMYDGTPEEIATNFKNQGNDAFREKRYQDAVSFYTQALSQKCTDNSIDELCYANRAAANIELENFRRAISDCASCLRINPKNVKALYRSGRAFGQLEKYDEALECLDRSLQLEPNNKATLAEKESISKKRLIQQKKRLEIEERQRKERERIENLQSAFKSRGIHLLDNSPFDPETPEEQRPKLDAEGVLHLPVFFLYPEFKQSDFIADMRETDIVGDHVATVLEHPAPWDTRAEYTADNVDLLFEARQEGPDARRGLLRVGLESPLSQVLANARFGLRGGTPSFIVLPKKSSFRDQFVADYKSRSS